MRGDSTDSALNSRLPLSLLRFCVKGQHPSWVKRELIGLFLSTDSQALICQSNHESRSTATCATTTAPLASAVTSSASSRNSKAPARYTP